MSDSPACLMIDVLILSKVTGKAENGVGGPGAIAFW